MPTELFANYLPNQAAITLGADVVTTPASGTSETWTVVVPTGIVIPTIGVGVGQLRGVIDSEIVIITGGATVAGTQSWTVTRGQESTATATHTTGTTLVLDVTAGALSSLTGGYVSNEKDAANYADFASAITAIGSTPTSLIVHTSMTVSTTVIVPATCSLVFRGTGVLSVATGATVTINGPISASPTQRIFSLTGTAAVNLAAGSTAQLWVEWFGAKGDASLISGSGTDSTAAIQAAINAVPQYGGIDVCFAGGQYRITSSLNVVNTSTYGYKSNMNLVGRAGRGSDIGVASWLIWDSATSTTPLLNLHTSYSTVTGFTFTVCNGKTLLCGVDIDIDATHTTGTSYICTQNRVRDCTFTNYAGSGHTGVMTDGVRISAVATANTEFMAFEFCSFISCAHAGIYLVAGTYQSTQHEVHNCNFSSMPYGVYNNSGSFNFFQCNYASLSTCAMYMGATGQTNTVAGCNSESSAQIWSQPAGGGPPAVFTGGRYSPDALVGNPAAGSEYFSSSGPIVMVGVDIESGAGSTFARIATPYLHITGGSLPSGSNLFTTIINAAQQDGHLFCFGNKGQTDQIFLNPGQHVGNSLLSLTAPVNGTLTPIGGFAIRANPPSNAFFAVPSTTGGSFTFTTSTRSILYRVSLVTANGEVGQQFSTNVSTLGTATSTGSFALTNLPIGPAGTTSRKVYRNDTGTWYLAGTISDNTATTFTDTGGIGTTATPPATDTSGLTTGKFGAVATDMLTATTVGTAGAATALPANPVGYLDIEVNGAVRKVPYYNP